MSEELKQFVLIKGEAKELAEQDIDMSSEYVSWINQTPLREMSESLKMLPEFTPKEVKDSIVESCTKDFRLAHFSSFDITFAMMGAMEPEREQLFRRLMNDSENSRYLIWLRLKKNFPDYTFEDMKSVSKTEIDKICTEQLMEKSRLMQEYVKSMEEKEVPDDTEKKN
jgi:hypothetical protein